MKKILPVLIVLFLVLATFSCGKPTKRKLANDWTITSYEEKNTYGSAGATEPLSSDEIRMTETEITHTNFYKTPWDPNEPDHTTIETGTVQLHQLSIKKDGTWSWEQDYTYVDSTSRQTISEQTGSWDFLGKNKEDGFKKNERIVLNVLTAHEIQYESNNGQPAVVKNEKTYTYTSGENQVVFVISSLTDNELQLESDFTQTHKQNSAGSSQWTSVKRIILKNK